MKVVPNLVGEFEELCAEYSAHGDQGKDIVILVKMFGEANDNLHTLGGLKMNWVKFLEEHHRQMTMPMTGMILYVLVTYWHLGQKLFEALPTLEKMLLRDTVQEISEEIDRKSAANGNAVVAASD